MKQRLFYRIYTRSGFCLSFFLILISVLSPGLFPAKPCNAAAFSIVILSQYRAGLDIGDSFRLFAVSADGKVPRFKSSNSRVAAVSTYGTVTARKSGACRITARTSSGEASCLVTVRKTAISIAAKRISIEHNEVFSLDAQTSNQSEPTYRSSRKSVASVDENGIITGGKPGEAVITIKADDTTATCKVRVKKPTIQLNTYSARLYRCQKLQLTAKVSSGIEPTWKSSRTSVATVDEHGVVTARKHGTALITAKVDGISRICEITVEPPVIRLNPEKLIMKKGHTARLHIHVSSGNSPQIKSSKTTVAKISSTGLITARKPGTATITVTEDGAKEQCLVTVTE